MQAIDWPFRAGEMLDAGALTSWELRRFYQAVYPGVWIPRGAELTPQLHCVRAAAATHLCRFRGHIRRVAHETAQPR
jgi:hypothetical protein